MRGIVTDGTCRWNYRVASFIHMGMKLGIFALAAVAVLAGLALLGASPQKAHRPSARDAVVKTNAEWKKVLTPEQYRILREAGTEQAFTGKLWNNHAPGTYICAACGNELFSSKTKFESGTGWPSFWQPIRKGAVDLVEDRSWAVEVRTEVLCSRCGGHLGHVFEDGPRPTGQRYCMNSGAMKFIAAK